MNAKALQNLITQLPVLYNIYIIYIQIHIIIYIYMYIIYILRERERADVVSQNLYHQGRY